ncbi:hypothetical protein [Bacillus taeanensis]|uniref:hypothetical protein n=1 Tax=Bacillus taeanensis TaxID=273032 RepID=UPI0015F030D0|nr:hypothetical protein [Bacillus taeanensis]
MRYQDKEHAVYHQLSMFSGVEFHDMLIKQEIITQMLADNEFGSSSKAIEVMKHRMRR